MPRTSTPETRPDAVGGLTEVVEATTAEAAIEQVHARLGPDARILDARRVLRGGIAGFFSRGHVQLHAAPAATPDPAPPAAAVDPDPPAAAADPAPPAAAVDPDPTVHASPVDRLLEGASEVPEAVDFATYLRSQLDDGASEVASPDVAAAVATLVDERPAWATPRPASATPPAPPMPPAAIDTTTAADVHPVTPGPMAAPDEPRAATDGGPAWSIPALLRLGLPAQLVRGLEVAAPQDDLAWTNALAEAVRPLCRPLPAGPSVLVGPAAHRLTEVADAPAARSRTWLTALGSGRWRHLVLGGAPWREELDHEPLAVSWTRAEELPDALRCAAELGLVLGFGSLRPGFGRARPLDVALEVRDLVDHR